MTLGDEILKQFAGLQVWEKGEERAPHKPLLVLYALGCLQQGKNRLQPFLEIEPKLKRLLAEFGPPRKSIHPEYPFWYLKTDKVWEVSYSGAMDMRKGKNFPKIEEIRKVTTLGGFTEHIYQVLLKHPEILRSVAHQILESHFPTTLHSTIATEANLNLDETVRHAARDPNFRRGVISAWGYQCGFCGYDLRLDGIDIGLEAAHVQWVQAGGSDVMGNGIACCRLHHLAFDRGAIGIDENLRIIVSSRIHGKTLFDELFLSLCGKSLKLPSLKTNFPERRHLNWHRQEVFRGEPRDL